MQKIGFEIKFEQNYSTALRELKIIEKNPTQAKIDAIRPKIKQLEKCILNIQSTLFTDRKINRYDAQRKVISYKQQKKSFQISLQKIEQNLRKAALFKHQTEQQNSDPSDLKTQNRKKALQLQQQTMGIHKEIVEVAGIVNNTKLQLHDQAKRLDGIQNDADEAELELTMIDQFMRMISNRNLLTKIILILLVIFLALADLTIFILKIS